MKKKIQANLKNVRSAEKRLSTRIVLLEKKMDAEAEHIDDLSAVIVQKTSQLNSLGRLIDGAKQRMSMEKDEIASIQQNLTSSSNSAGKQNARDRLEQLTGNAKDLAFEIAHREKTTEKVTRELDQYTKIRSKSVSAIQKRVEMKMSLEVAMAETLGKTKNLTRDLAKQIREVTSAELALAKESQRLQNGFAKKPKATSAKKPAKKPKATSAKKPAKKPKTTSAKKPAKKPNRSVS